MRNLKKVLSLALALVMLLGMMVVGAGAAEYNDAASIGDDYKEAVDVISAINVMQGRTASSFQPEGTLTRAEAATIITRALVGRSTADALAKNTESRFSDMQGHWAAGAVEYCYDRGIVRGTTATTFNPGRPVSSMEYTAMVLRALKLVDADNASGGNWKTETIAAAAQNGLSDSSLVVSDLPMKRQEAAKMAFNGIQYSPSGTKAYKVGDQTFDNAFDAYVYAQNTGGTIEVTTAKDSLAVINFGLSKADATANGRTGYTWQINGRNITGFIATDKELYSGTAVTPATTGVRADSSVEYYLNGAKKTAADLTGRYIRGNELTLVDVNGNGRYDKVLLIEKTFATVNADPVERNGKVIIAGAVTGSVDADKVSGWEGLAEGDKVLTYPMADGITYIEKLATVEGAVTGRTGNTDENRTWFVDGGSYKVTENTTNAGAATENLTAALGEKDGVRLYLDKFAVVWDVESAIVKPSNYAVLTDIVWVDGVVTAGGSNSGYAEAQLLLTDHTTVKYRIDSINGAKPVASSGTLSATDGSTSNYWSDKSTFEEALKKTNATSTTVPSSLTIGNYVVEFNSAKDKELKKYVVIAAGSDANSKTALEGEFYTFSETGTANHATLQTVGMNQKTGAMDDSKVYILSGTDGHEYVPGAPNMVYGTSLDTTIALNNGTKFLLKSGNQYYDYTGIAGENRMVGVKSTSSSKPSFTAVINKTTGIATHVYVVGEAAVATTTEVVFVTNDEWNYSASTKTYTFEAIVDGDVNGTIETTKTDVRDKIDGIGLYTVTRTNDGKIDSAAPATVGENVKVAVKADSDKNIKAPAVEKANLVVIKINNNSYTYSDDTRVFYVDADGTASSGTATSVGKYLEGDLGGVWAVVKNGNGNAAEQAALTDLYLLAKPAGSSDNDDVKNGKSPVSGTNVTANTDTASTLTADYLKALTPGLYTFKEMPSAITDAGSDVSKLLLFRWNNTSSTTTSANIEILNSTGTVIWNAWTGPSLSTGTHYSYILIQKPGATKLWNSDDNGLFIADGSYTWRVTLSGGNAPVAQGSFNVKW